MNGEPLSTISQERADTLTKWLGIWIGAGLVIVAILAVFLIAMLGSLNSIKDNLGTASTEVVNSGKNVQPLSNDLEQTNATMTALNAAMGPVPGLTADATASLKGIQGALGSVSRSMGVTENNLATTAGLLDQTTNSLSGSSSALSQIEVSITGAVKPLKSVSTTLGGTIAPLQGIAAALGQTETIISDTVRLIKEITAHLKKQAAKQATPTATAG